MLSLNNLYFTLTISFTFGLNTYPTFFTLVLNTYSISFTFEAFNSIEDLFSCLLTMQRYDDFRNAVSFVIHFPSKKH